MKILNERYVKVTGYKGFDICTLKEAIPSNGDKLSYVIDHENFNDQEYNHPEEAIRAIDNYKEQAII